LHDQGECSAIKWAKNGWLVMSLAILLLCAFLAAPDLARAAPETPVQIKAEMGWQGKVVPGRYAPVVIQLKNTGGDYLSGLAEGINYHSYRPPAPPGSPPGQPTRHFPSAAFAQRVSLPPGAEKSITLWMPMNGPGERVDFVFRAGDVELARVQEKVPGSSVSHGPMPGAVGVLGEVPPALERVRVI